MGSDLSEWILRRGPLPVEQAVDFAIQACDGLAQAHLRGIVHRDIKPASLFVIERPGAPPSVKVGRWDLSMSVGSGATEKGAIVGTVAYMPPERLRGTSDCDERSDIWSLGITLCEMLTGEVLCEKMSLPQILSTVVSGAPLPFPDSFSRLPRGLQAVIRKCVERDVLCRYQSVTELAQALRDAET
jgi:eukaryotic-like serine/threonine-protein kinase